MKLGAFEQAATKHQAVMAVAAEAVVAADARVARLRTELAAAEAAAEAASKRRKTLQDHEARIKEGVARHAADVRRASDALTQLQAEVGAHVHAVLSIP